MTSGLTNLITRTMVYEDVTPGQILFEMNFIYSNDEILCLQQGDYGANISSPTLYVFFNINSGADLTASFQSQLYGI